MRQLIYLELKAQLTRPLWVVLAAFVGWAFFHGLFDGAMATTIHLGLELPFEGVGAPLLSLGDWGRALLLMLNTLGGSFISLLVALLAARSCNSELGHREVLWTTSRGGSLRMATVRLVVFSSLATFLVAAGACWAFLNPSIRDTRAPAGWQYLPLYLALAWIRIALWVALTMFFFHLTRSQWAAAMLVFASQTAWFGIGGIWPWPSALLKLLHRNLVAWNFVSPFAPLGVIPLAFALQGVILAGLTLVFLGAVPWVRRRLPEWCGIRSVAGGVTLCLGAALAAVAGAMVIREIERQTAPFTAVELWEGKANFDRPYIWSRDRRLLFHPGDFMALRLPPDLPTPGWVEDLAEGKEVRRHDDAGTIILQGHLGEARRTSSQSLVLVHPQEKPYPCWLDQLVGRYWEDIRPVVERARLWVATTPKLAVLWPEDAVPLLVHYVGPAYRDGQLRIAYWALTGSTRSHRWKAARAFAEAVDLDKPARTYLRLYLMAEVDRQGVEEALAYFRAWSEGKAPKSSLSVFAVDGLWKVNWYAEVLRYWRQGEEMGHENFVRMLLQGGGR